MGATLKKNRLQIMGKVGPRAQQKATKEEKTLASKVSRDAKKVVRKQKRLDQTTQAEQLAKIVEKRSKSVLKKTGEAAIKAATKLAEDKAKQKKKPRLRSRQMERRIMLFRARTRMLEQLYKQRL